MPQNHGLQNIFLMIQGGMFLPILY